MFHSVHVGIVRSSENLFVELSIKGKLTHADYEHFVPMIKEAMESLPNKKMRMIVDMRGFEGFELRAAWDDFKFGLEFRNDFEKLAVVGNKNWEKYATKLGSWLLGGEVRYFTDADKAMQWVDS